MWIKRLDFRPATWLDVHLINNKRTLGFYPSVLFVYGNLYKYL